MFLNKYFPLSRINALKQEIFQFKMDRTENLHCSWARYQGILEKLPAGEIKLWEQIDYYYRGLTPTYRLHVNVVVGRALEDLTPNEA